MKDIDVYIIVAGLFLMAGFARSSGINSTVLQQISPIALGLLACGTTLGIILYKLRNNSSKN